MPSLQERARALAVAQDFGAEALELNRRLVGTNPADIAARTRLGRCLLETGRLDEAEAEYREVLRLDPRNRIASGGLERIEECRHPAPVVRPRARGVTRETRTGSVRSPRAARLRPERSEATAVSTAPEQVPETFSGFARETFAELECCRRAEVQPRFSPRVLDLVRRVNALESSVEIARIRDAAARRLFRAGRSDVHAGPSHWYVFNFGGRWEAQFNIGMYGGRPAGNWLRMGIGFNLATDATDAVESVRVARDWFRRFQDLIASPRRSLLLGWMVREGGFLEHNGGGPLQDLRDPSDIAALVTDANPERTRWLFFGKWLSPDNPDHAAVLSEPVSLVRTIDRVFSGLTPLWRALHE